MQRRLPNFIIIGAAKAGTTSLYNYMNQHPQIFMSPIKETRFFSYDDKQTREDLQRMYSTYFPVKTVEEYENLFKDAKNELIIGEATPSYLTRPRAAYKIKELLPKAKLLAILRNPVDRAISGYILAVRDGKETRDANAAFKKDSYFVQNSYYYENLKRYFDLFPREQIKICLYDDFKKDTLSVTQEIFTWLDIDATFEPDVASRYNVGGLPKNRVLNIVLIKIGMMGRYRSIHSFIPDFVIRRFRATYTKNLGRDFEIPQDLRSRLIELYREDILKVQDLISRDLQHWLKP